VESAKDPTQILGDAVITLAALKSYRVVFSGKDAIGPLTFDMMVDGNGQAAQGTMVQSNVPSEVTIAGSTLYVQQQPLAEALLQRTFNTTVAGWVRIPLATIPDLATLVSPSMLAQCANADAGTDISGGSQSKVAGTETIALTLTERDDTTSIITNTNVINVSLDGQANVVEWQIEQAASALPSCTGGTQVSAGVDNNHPSSLIGTLTFSDFNQKISVPTPSPAVDPPPRESGY